ncbi:ABC transporter substrate-binding protein [Marinivivus vitaminiproducens]|uniref:ABC transporter substrate-binding protein n=1 Tax=Marinivivus vitaminiproducens TaxID=3035935 RepID=UPI0027A7D4DB|nr:ABC transporter substrate-binding protein [Geminicoccaceae bacterium SCSIO 64248]
MATPDAQARPHRIVSLNLCTDELVLRLADPGQIASVTWLARNSTASNVSGRARSVPLNHGLAEQVLTQRADLVLAGTYTTRTTVAFLRRLGIPVIELPPPSDLGEAYRQIREVAALVGHADRGEVMVASMRASLASTPLPERDRVRAFVLQPNGFTVQKGSLVDTLMRQAGLRNLAAEERLGAQGQVPLEQVVLADAELLIVDGDDGDHPALANAVLHHPVLDRLGGRVRIVRFPHRLWTCAGPGLVEAVRRLSEEAGRIRRTVAP